MVGGGQGTWGPAKIIVKHTAAPLSTLCTCPRRRPSSEKSTYHCAPCSLGRMGEDEGARPPG